MPIDDAPRDPSPRFGVELAPATPQTAATDRDLSPSGRPEADKLASAMDEDFRLVQRALDGDAAASDELAERLLPVVRRQVARFLLARKAYSEGDLYWRIAEVSQRVLIQIFTKEPRPLSRWSPKMGLLEQYVGGIVKNVARSVLREERKEHSRVERTDLETVEGKLPRTSSFENAVADREILELVVDELQERLTPQAYDVFCREHVDGQSPQQIHEQTGLTVANINQIRHRNRIAAQKLWAELSNEESDD